MTSSPHPPRLLPVAVAVLLTAVLANRWRMQREPGAPAPSTTVRPAAARADGATVPPHDAAPPARIAREPRATGTRSAGHAPERDPVPPTQDVTHAPSRALMRSAIRDALARHAGAPDASPGDVDALIDAMWLARDSYDALATLEPTPANARRIAELRANVELANAEYARLLGIAPGTGPTAIGRPR